MQGVGWPDGNRNFGSWKVTENFAELFALSAKTPAQAELGRGTL